MQLALNSLLRYILEPRSQSGRGFLTLKKAKFGIEYFILYS